jgi:hypothetical protein
VSKTYGATQTYLGGEFTSLGLVNSETIGSVTLSSTGDAANVNVAVSPYVITASNATGGTFNANNYTISYVDGALTVNAAPLSITANDAGKTYDGLAYTGGNGVTYNGFVNGENNTVLGGALVYGGSSQGAINAGSYAIRPSGLTSGNYTINFVDGTLIVLGSPSQVAEAYIGPGGESAYESAVVTASSTASPAILASDELPASLRKAIDQSGNNAGAGNTVQVLGGFVTLVNGGLKMPDEVLNEEGHGI